MTSANNPLATAVAANDFAVSNLVAGTAASMLKAKLVLGRLVFRDAEPDYEGGRGDTLRIRVPRVIDAVNFTGSTSAIATPVKERAVPISLTQHGMNAVDLTARDMTLNVGDFLGQVVNPQVAGVAKYCEKAISVVLQGTIDASTVVIDPKNPRDAIIDAGAVLDTNEVQGRRVLVVDPSVKAMLLKDPNLSHVDDAGTDGALRDANVGRLHGFDVFMTPYVKGAVAMSVEAYAAAFRAPAKPLSVFGSSKADEDGQHYALTWFMAFDAETRTERSICEVFAGATVLDSARAVGLKLK